MITFKYTIADEHGIHARPAGMLVGCAKKFDSDIRVAKDGHEVDAKHLLAVMSLAGRHGEELTFTVNGSDEEHAAAELERVCRDQIG